MVEFTGGDENKSFTPDKITSKLFLSSIRNWYKEEGVPAGVEKVGKQFLFISHIKHISLMMKLLFLSVEKMGRYTLQRTNIILRIMLQYHLMQVIRIC